MPLQTSKVVKFAASITRMEAIHNFLKAAATAQTQGRHNAFFITSIFCFLLSTLLPQFRSNSSTNIIQTIEVKKKRMVEQILLQTITEASWAKSWLSGSRGGTKWWRRVDVGHDGRECASQNVLDARFRWI